MRADTMFGAGPGTPVDDSSLLCFASDPAKTSTQLGRPFWRVTHHGGKRMSEFMYNSRIKFSSDK